MTRKKKSISLDDKEFYAFMAKYIHKHYEKWRRKYLNVVGIDLGRKTAGGETSGIPAIIFYVIDKTDNIREEQKIPSYFRVAYKNKRVSVDTDLVKTGDSVLHFIHPGSAVFQFSNTMKRGTMGPIVFKESRPHILSNMHVLGWSYLHQSASLVDHGVGGPLDISSSVNGGPMSLAQFRIGMVDQQIDAALAIVPDEFLQNVNEFREIIDIDNPMEFPLQNIDQPFTVNMFGSLSGVQSSNVVSAVAVRTFSYPFGSQSIFNLIALKPCCSQPGDSGSAVYDPNSKSIIGIIVGTDDQRQFSYVIPYVAIKTALGID